MAENLILKALIQDNRSLALSLIKQMAPFQLSQGNAAGQTPLHVAVQKNYVEIAQALLEQGANVDALAKDLSYRYMTPLHYAALTGNLIISKLLLYYGANTQIKNSQAQTPADIAALHGFIEVAHLISHGSKIPFFLSKPSIEPPSIRTWVTQKAKAGDSNNIVDLAQYKKQLKH